jgi:hypothetical protein
MQFTIGVGVNNNHFEYWSSNYLCYTMSYTSTCPITYFTQKYNDLNVERGVLNISDEVGGILKIMILRLGRL